PRLTTSHPCTGPPEPSPTAPSARAKPLPSPAAAFKMSFMTYTSHIVREKLRGSTNWFENSDAQWFPRRLRVRKLTAWCRYLREQERRQEQVHRSISDCVPRGAGLCATALRRASPPILGFSPC